MKPYEKILNKFPQAGFSCLPTPLQRLNNISQELGINLYCKRDDLTGFAMGGNKTRKLDFLAADAKMKKADTLVAIGGIQSNFCRIAAAAGRSVGLDVHLLLGGKRPRKAAGNLLLDELFGASLHFVRSEDWSVWEKEARLLSERLKKGGRKVYYLPVGGSTPVGALGYVKAFLEMMDDFSRHKIKAGAIIHASSSAGTQAGLVVGKKLSGWGGKIIGMGVAKTRGALTDEVFELASKVGGFFGIKIDKKDILIDSSYMGPAYAARTAACEEALRLFAECEGIVLDHVYTGKAAAGMIDYALHSRFRKDAAVVFLHTGGNIEVFSGI